MSAQKTDEPFEQVQRRAERAFAQAVRKYGSPGPVAKRLDLQPPLADDGDTDCWTYAWRYAEAHPGSRYVEGLCVRGKGLAQHAWVEEDTAFGPRIVEFTPGYENATGYRGLMVPMDSEVAVAGREVFEPDECRSSILQLTFNYWGVEQGMAMLRRRA